MKKNNLKKLHLGCGPITPAGWLNVDASLSARLAKHGFLVRSLKTLGLIEKNKKMWGEKAFLYDLRKPLPFKNNSFEVIYSSHLLEHLYLDESQSLLKECFRILKPKGIMRLVVPDLEAMIRHYLSEKKHRDDLAADHLNENLLLRAKTESGGNWLYRQYKKITDFNSHKWMYDAKSLTYYLKKAGFVNVQEKSLGKSLIRDISALEKPSLERNPSVYLECIKPEDEIYPKISVVIPSFNQGNFIGQTIRSILNQKYPNLELIIIDGGSSDDTLKIIKKYRKKIDYFISEKDKGQSDAINKGMKRAKGEILAYLNSDDYYLPGTLKKIASAFRHEKGMVDLIYGDTFTVDEKNKFLRYDLAMDFKPHEYLFGILSIPQPGAFWTKKAYQKAGSFNIKNHSCMDGEFFLHLNLAGRKFKRLNEPLACFRVHQHSKSGSGSYLKQYKDDCARIRKKYFGRNLPILFIYLNNTYYRLKYLPLRTYRRILAPKLPKINL